MLMKVKLWEWLVNLLKIRLIVEMVLVLVKRFWSFCVVVVKGRFLM